jgi:DNA polymerase-4
MQRIISQLPSPKPYSTMYIDMDSFFASVEQFYMPELRGKPVGVATGVTKGASIIAASAEAKRLGVRGGTKVDVACLMCPEIVVVHDSPNSYRAVHRQIMTVLQSTFCTIQAKSIDEAVLKIPHYAQNEEAVFALIKAIKDQIYNLYNEHIQCSIGVSSNTWLAKMAASYNKPNGVYMVDNKEEFYSSLSLLALTGIGQRMKKRMFSLGLYSPLDIYRATQPFLRKSLGVEGEKWYFRMRGYEVDEHHFAQNKSLSHQVTTIPDYPETYDKITTYLIKISEVLGMRLRDKKLKARSVSLGLYSIDYNYQSSNLKKLLEFNDTLTLTKYLLVLLKRLKIDAKIKKINVAVGDVTSTWQLDMDTYLSNIHTGTIYSGLDTLTQKYQDNLVSSLQLADSNHIDLERVGFAGDIMRETSDISNY